jgi:hypothetical protein
MGTLARAAAGPGDHSLALGRRPRCYRGKLAPMVASIYGNREWTFMNYGYVPSRAGDGTPDLSAAAGAAASPPGTLLPHGGRGASAVR